MEPSKLLIWLQLAAIAGGGFYVMGQLRSDFDASKRFNTRQFDSLQMNLSKQSSMIEKNQHGNAIKIDQFNELLQSIEVELLLVKKDVDSMDNVLKKM
ncbi:hypothetical protein [Shewanella sp. YLB-07]|uniref:hypothetical protein n=1 Tax=Shewanella sp. YLB-07 TaxID=2601268 RepID=UPI00128C2156|nr:hypothetical protein [Shewanella sp. YLB-07]MPY24370.1 hypothetical protein [Shewanella sp. YLB-07]